MLRLIAVGVGSAAAAVVATAAGAVWVFGEKFEQALFSDDDTED